MKILFLAPANSVHAIRWINFFSQLPDFQIEVLTLGHIDRERFDKKNIKIEKLNFLNFWSHYKRRDATIVHVHSIARYLFLAWLLGIKVDIASPWGSDLIFFGETLIGRLLHRLMFSKISLFTVDAEHMKIRLIEKGVDSKKIKKINFGVDTDYYIPRNNPIKITQTITFLTGRGFSSVYNNISISKAAIEIMESHQNTNFVFMGEGLERLICEQMLSKYISSGRVLFTGRYNPEEYLQKLHKADAYISASFSDAGISSAIAEAMSAGLPIIASNTGENKDWIIEENSELLFDPKKYTDLVLKINKYIENKDLYDSLAMKNREIIIRNNSFNNEMNKMKKIYNEEYFK